MRPAVIRKANTRTEDKYNPDSRDLLGSAPFGVGVVNSAKETRLIKLYLPCPKDIDREAPTRCRRRSPCVVHCGVGRERMLPSVKPAQGRGHRRTASAPPALKLLALPPTPSGGDASTSNESQECLISSDSAAPEQRDWEFALQWSAPGEASQALEQIQSRTADSSLPDWVDVLRWSAPNAAADTLERVRAAGPGRPDERSRPRTDSDSVMASLSRRLGTLTKSKAKDLSHE